MVRGTFTLEELQLLFPMERFGPWQDLQDHTCFLIAASTGLRRGEILALRWCDLELEAGFVRVEQAWKDDNELGTPKWDHLRTVPFLLFQDRVRTRLAAFEEHSIRIATEDLIFCHEDGKRLGNTWWRQRFDSAMKNTGIDRKARQLSPHSFRHYAERRIMSNTNDKVLFNIDLDFLHSA